MRPSFKMSHFTQWTIPCSKGSCKISSLIPNCHPFPWQPKNLMTFIRKNSSNHFLVTGFLLKQVYLLNIWFWLKDCIFHPVLERNMSTRLQALPVAPLSFITCTWKVAVIVNLCHTVTFVFPMRLKCASVRKAYYVSPSHILSEAWFMLLYIIVIFVEWISC